VDRIAPEVALEVLVGFQQGDGDPLPGQEQGEHHAGGTGTDDTAGRLLNVMDDIGGWFWCHQE
jgi:hypothetical protein